LGKFAFVASVCIVLLASLAHAQKLEVMVGGATLMSTAPPSDLANFHPPTEKGGTYVALGANYLRFKHHLGLNAETSWRYHQTHYPYNGETYRPILTDVNVLFQPQITKKITADLFAGVGVASTHFNLLSTPSCSISSGGCVNYDTSNHFMEDLGIGVRYYVWHRLPRVFVRPEVHYYHIQNNVEFSSPNVFRVGASVGYSFGSK
jgi:hypothetical protein